MLLHICRMWNGQLFLQLYTMTASSCYIYRLFRVAKKMSFWKLSRDTFGSDHLAFYIQGDATKLTFLLPVNIIIDLYQITYCPEAWGKNGGGKKKAC